MGFISLEIKLPPDYTEGDIKNAVRNNLHIEKFDYKIERKSLDARNKSNIHWLIRLQVESDTLKGTASEEERLVIPEKVSSKKVVVVGSGPAGFFSAYVLAKAGFKVTLIDRGTAVEERSIGIAEFEKGGKFDPKSNYAFGEGGAGTFSDGKLTSRSKNITKEKKFFFESYIKSGAPDDISYLAMPHVGSDNLIRIVKSLREEFISDGGEILFETQMTGINRTDGIIKSIETTSGKLEADYFIFAFGHSAYDTYRMLIKEGIGFTVKPFAIGMRAEHPVEIINKSQWGQTSLPGLTSAEYKLTYSNPGEIDVYTFCMCPGGKIIQAAAFEGLNIVNGMSYYNRSLPNSNSAVVAAANLDVMLGKDVEALEALDYVESIERKFFDISKSYKAPAISINKLISGKSSGSLPKSSYSHGIFEYDFNEILPKTIVKSIRRALMSFGNKIRGYEEGILVGLESKTSSPIRATREKDGQSVDANNLYICGEGSGYSGGIVSSAADGIKSAFSIINREA